MAAVVFLACAGATSLALAARFARGALYRNEPEVLPYALQRVDPAWLPGDWYLNIENGYRHLFSPFAGYLVRSLGFLHAAYLGRILSVICFSLALQALFRALRIRPWLALPCALFFATDQNLMAGEWMLSGFETKAFAYPALLASMAAFASRRYRWMWVSLGLTVSLHVLVGGYGAIALLSCFAITPYREDLWAALRSAWWFLPFGAGGIYALGAYLSGPGLPDGEAALAARLYVEFRNPHHTLPSHINDAWGAILIRATVAFAVARIDQEPRVRLLGQFGVAAASFWLVGGLLEALDYIELLRFYWLRLADVMLPLLLPILIALVGSIGLDAARFRGRWPLRIGLAALAVVLVVPDWIRTVGSQIVDEKQEFVGIEVKPVNLDQVEPKTAPRHRFIREQLPADACLIAPPGMDRIYVDTERRVIANFKFVPNTPGAILEWHRRLLDLAGGQALKKRGYGAAAELNKHFRRLSEENIRGLEQRYDCHYLLTDRKPAYPFRELHKSDSWRVYALDKGVRSDGTSRP